MESKKCEFLWCVELSSETPHQNIVDKTVSRQGPRSSCSAAFTRIIQPTTLCSIVMFTFLLSTSGTSHPCWLDAIELNFIPDLGNRCLQNNLASMVQLGTKGFFNPGLKACNSSPLVMLLKCKTSCDETENPPDMLQ